MDLTEEDYSVNITVFQIDDRTGQLNEIRKKNKK